MSFRTVYISNQSRCTYKNGYLVIRQAEQTMIHLSEIDIVVMESTASFFSTYLLSELAKARIPVVVCDTEHNPVGEYCALYGTHDSSRRVTEQAHWSQEAKDDLWGLIVKSKILNQAAVLESVGLVQTDLLREYAAQVVPGDRTNREGHAAKVYFNALFGKEFSRDRDCSVNAMLNYGYTILLAWVNREIVRRGYLTQLGICHRNDYNHFNLGCDFMEPFRPIVDAYALRHSDDEFDKEARVNILALFGHSHEFDGGTYKLSSILGLVTKSNLGILSGRSGLEGYKDFCFVCEG